MQYKNLGKSGLKVSRLCLGTMNFGTYTNEREAFKIMDAAIDAGVNFFDTANVYGGDDKHGLTEEIIGRWFSQGKGKRDKVILGTKVYGDMFDIDGSVNDDSLGLSKYKIRHHFEASLKRLQTDHIELYQMHHSDREASWDEVWEAFMLLTQQGKIDYVGSSNFAGWDLAVAQYTAKSKGFFGLISEQHKYNLLCRLPELEVIPAAEQLGIGIIPYSPLSGGALSGKNIKQNSRSFNQFDRIKDLESQLSRFSNLCKELGEEENVIALAWLLSNPVVTAPLLGPRTLEQFNTALRAIEVDLSDEVINLLDDIFPGPGGTAPEAYAW